jgi:hypothetical protein
MGRATLTLCEEVESQSRDLAPGNRTWVHVADTVQHEIKGDVETSLLAQV